MLSGPKNVPDSYWNVCVNCWKAYKDSNAPWATEVMMTNEQEDKLREFLAGCKTVVLMSFTDAPTTHSRRWVPFNG
jgi:hypothetical protein